MFKSMFPMKGHDYDQTPPRFKIDEKHIYRSTHDISEFCYCIRCVFLHLLQQPGSTSLISGCYTPLLLQNGQNWLYAQPAEKVKSLKIIIFPTTSQPAGIGDKPVLPGKTPLKLNAAPIKKNLEHCLSLGDFEFFT